MSSMKRWRYEELRHNQLTGIHILCTFQEESVHKLLEKCRKVGDDYVLDVELWPSGGTGNESFTSSVCGRYFALNIRCANVGYGNFLTTGFFHYDHPDVELRIDYLAY